MGITGEVGVLLSTVAPNRRVGNPERMHAAAMSTLLFMIVCMLFILCLFCVFFQCAAILACVCIYVVVSLFLSFSAGIVFSCDVGLLFVWK